MTQTMSTYKNELLGNVRTQMIAAGGALKVEGSGRTRHAVLVDAAGAERVIYFPTGSALHGVDVDDLREAAQQMTARGN